jgi:hypothetical protein
VGFRPFFEDGTVSELGLEVGVGLKKHINLPLKGRDFGSGVLGGIGFIVARRVLVGVILGGILLILILGRVDRHGQSGDVDRDVGQGRDTGKTRVQGEEYKTRLQARELKVGDGLYM